MQPEKWRETVDPFSLPYHSFQPLEILGYPHAGNDVFHIRGLYRGEEVRAYVKAARQPGAAIASEAAILRQLSGPVFPLVIDEGDGDPPFSVTLAMPGERLSVLLGGNEGLASLAFLPEYGAALAKLHRLSLPVGNQADRRFFHPPAEELLAKSDLLYLKDFFAHPPTASQRCFCHGDFHYANLLWQDGHISAILDFELAGYGDRDFDIAWAMFLRPGQRFFKTEDERQAFLRGYAEHGEYDPDAVRFYTAQCYVYFLQFSGNDPEYCGYVRDWLKSL